MTPDFSCFRRTRFARRTLPGNPTRSRNATKTHQDQLIAEKRCPKSDEVAKNSHQNRLHRVSGISSHPKSGISSYPKCVSPHPTQSVRATRSASPLPLPVAQRGLVIDQRPKTKRPQTEDQKTKDRRPYDRRPKTRPWTFDLDP